MPNISSDFKLPDEVAASSFFIGASSFLAGVGVGLVSVGFYKFLTIYAIMSSLLTGKVTFLLLKSIMSLNLRLILSGLNSFDLKR